MKASVVAATALINKNIPFRFRALHAEYTHKNQPSDKEADSLPASQWDEDQIKHNPTMWVRANIKDIIG